MPGERVPSSNTIAGVPLTLCLRLSSMLRGSDAGNLVRTNAVLVPLLVDMLPYRAPNQSTFVDNRSTKSSHADAAIPALIALTGHNEGYEPAAEFAVRDISAATIPPDFQRDARIHRAWEIRHR